MANFYSIFGYDEMSELNNENMFLYLLNKSKVERSPENISELHKKNVEGDKEYDYVLKEKYKAYKKDDKNKLDLMHGGKEIRLQPLLKNFTGFNNLKRR
jgi:hypothetical protein